jgi:hypothetical protein
VHHDNGGYNAGPMAYSKGILPDADHATKRILYLATSPEVEGVTGRYFADKKPI